MSLNLAPLLLKSRGDSEPIEAAEDELPALRALLGMLESAHAGEARFVGPDDQVVELGSAVVQAVMAVVDPLSRGRKVVVGSFGDLITLVEAASLLNITQARVLALVEAGELIIMRDEGAPLLSYSQVIDLKRRRAETQRRGIDEIARISQELQLYEATEQGQDGHTQ
jgi:hypothetical protein